MQPQTNIPDYISDDFSMFLENMTSLADPENPDLLSNYLTGLFQQIAKQPLYFTGMADQLAMAISSKIRINSKDLAQIDLSTEPQWADIKPFVGVHADARGCITEIMNNSEQELKTAVLLNHFYNSYDATPLKDDDSDDYDDVDNDEYNEYDENY